MNIVVITTIIASLFLVIGLAEPLAARMRLPYVVMLALLGILIGAGSTFFLHTELTESHSRSHSRASDSCERLSLCVSAHLAVSGDTGHGPAPHAG